MGLLTHEGNTYRRDAEAAARREAATARCEALRERRRRNPRADDGRFFWEEIRDVLWEAGVVETHAGFKRPGIVSVRPERIPLAPVWLPQERLRPDRECEVLEEAQRVLTAAGYRAEIAWDHDPPRLFCTTRPVETDLFG